MLQVALYQNGMLVAHVLIEVRLIAIPQRAERALEGEPRRQRRRRRRCLRSARRHQRYRRMGAQNGPIGHVWSKRQSGRRWRLRLGWHLGCDNHLLAAAVEHGNVGGALEQTRKVLPLVGQQRLHDGAAIVGSDRSSGSG